MRRAVILDCEGPITKNDNAFELASHYIPNGDKLFTVLSRYDDILAYFLRRTEYKAGNTLKLVLPFLKAYDVTDQDMQEYSAQSLILVSNAINTLKYVRSVAHTFIVSTSYEHYIKALCHALDFPYENTYCTKVNIDKYSFEKNKNRLKKLAAEISQMPITEIPQEAKTLRSFSEQHQRMIQRLDEIFWKELSSKKFGNILDDVSPVGSGEKANAVKEAALQVGIDMSDIIYIGDSITDVDALRLVKENGGLAVSFNGNQYAVKDSEIAILSEDSTVTAIISDVFCRFGKREALRLVENWSSEALAKSTVRKTLLDCFFKLHKGQLPKARVVTSENMKSLGEESSEFRKTVRGDAIGRLG